MNGQTKGFVSRMATALAAVAAFAAAGCSSKGTNHPPFPTDVDPCAAYCLVWVPPVYTDVPRVAIKKCAKMATDCVPIQRTTFEEVCVPGGYEQRCVPCKQTKVQAVQVTPARQEWKSVKCPCTDQCCWKRYDIPPEYKCCERTETEAGFEYCAYTPPQYDVIAKTTCRNEKRSRYVPAEYGVCWEKQLYTPGHYEWQAKYGCKEPCPCPPKVPDCRTRDFRGIPCAD